MVIAIQTISSHPLLIRAVEETLADIDDFLLRPSAANGHEALSQAGGERLLLLDACSLQQDLGPFAHQFRTSSPGTKFIALLPPLSDGYVEELRLLYWGIDGFVRLHASWQSELPEAIRSIHSGQIWAPADVLSAFIQQTKLLQDAQLLPGQSLTARESQVLQLLMRHLPNKEISKTLEISERTTKFHVSNILGKLGFAGRNELFPENLAISLRSLVRPESAGGRQRHARGPNDKESGRLAERLARPPERESRAGATRTESQSSTTKRVDLAKRSPTLRAHQRPPPPRSVSACRDRS